LRQDLQNLLKERQLATEARQDGRAIGGKFLDAQIGFRALMPCRDVPATALTPLPTIDDVIAVLTPEQQASIQAAVSQRAGRGARVRKSITVKVAGPH